jgi:hypothetical protein
MDSLRRIDGPPRFRGRQSPLTETPSKSSALRPAYQPSSSRLPRELLNLSVLLSGLTDVHYTEASPQRNRTGNFADVVIYFIVFVANNRLI